MSDNRLGFSLIDADNHYYEAEDAFTRHGDEDVKRFVRWIQEGKRRKLVFGENDLRHACRTPRSTRSPRRARSTSG